jgi:hypothetical protein
MTNPADRLSDSQGIKSWTENELAGLKQDVSEAHARWPGPESLGAPTDEEVGTRSKGVTAGARIRLGEASRALYIAKMRSDDRTPWIELVHAHTKADLVKASIEVIDDDGVLRTQVVYTERGFGLKGDEALLFNAVEEFSRALNLIAAEREANRLAGLGGGRPSIDRSNIKTALNTLIKRHGRDKLLAKPVSWILERLRDELSEAAAADQPQPSDNILRSEIADALPGHPKLNRKKSFNNGGS